MPCIHRDVRSLGALLGAALGVLSSCNEIAGIEPPKACKADADCASEPGCGACDHGVCVLAAGGVPGPDMLQTAGDCLLRACDGEGGLGPDLVDDTDVPFNDNPCVAVSCSYGVLTREDLDGALSCYDGPEEAAGVGACTLGKQVCVEGVLMAACEGTVLPQLEVCGASGGEDLDCDGVSDEQAGGNTGCCGDGALQPAMEECDDGNADENDGCLSSCRIKKVEEIAAGAHFSCARITGGEIKCWGFNGHGQLGVGDKTDRGLLPADLGTALPPVDLGAIGEPSQIVLGALHACVRVAGRVKCWGDNAFGQLGVGDAIDRGDGEGAMGDALPFVNLGAGLNAVRIDAGGNHTCALLDDKSLRCWGRNDFGQLGIGNTAMKGDKPSELGDGLISVDLGPAEVEDVKCGAFHTCVLLKDGTVKCWGDNSFGQLGVGLDKPLEPLGDEPGEVLALPAVPLQKKAVAISAGRYETCALLDDGLFTCWGRNVNGELGQEDAMSTSDEGAVHNTAGLSAGSSRVVTAISAGGRAAGNQPQTEYGHACALLDGGAVKCWGSHIVGQLGQGGKLSFLGLGSNTNYGDVAGESIALLPEVPAVGGQPVIAISAGGRHTCILIKNGSVRCWGENAHGQLGRGIMGDYSDEITEKVSDLPAVNLFGAPQ